jgi:glycosyltransferase involved in cell wall biosynthesis
VRLAWLSPLPPLSSGIADYSIELLPLIAERASVEVFSPSPGALRSLRSPPGVTVLSPGSFPERAGSYDAVFHHLGNNPFHQFVYQAALEAPGGIAVLHEVVLHHLIEAETIGFGKRDLAGYSAILQAEYGNLGRRLADLRSRRVATEFDKFLFPLNGRIARGARAVVVHSQGARDRIVDVAPGVPVTVIPHHAGAPPPDTVGVSREEARARLDLPLDSFLVGQFGFLTRPKQPAPVLAGFARVAASRPNARLLVVGANQAGPGVHRLIRKYGLEGRVRLTGFVNLTRFYLFLKAVDAVVNLRYPSAGETSGTFARALAEGRATVVNNIGSFAEIPPDVALKVEVDEDQADAVASHLLRLAEDPQFKAAVEDRARAYAATALDPRRCADLYLQVAEESAQRNVAAAVTH